MKRVLMYTTGCCPFCVMAKRLLQQKGVAVDEVRVDHDAQQRDEMMRVTGRRTVPQIFVGSTHVGGYDDLSAMNRDGKLDPLLND